MACDVGVNIRVLFFQVFHHLKVPLRCRLVDWGPFAYGAGVHIRALFYQVFHQLKVAALCRHPDALCHHPDQGDRVCRSSVNNGCARLKQCFNQTKGSFFSRTDELIYPVFRRRPDSIGGFRRG
ncbi:hypothetical protein CI610_03374 [invertebrate metagenome]|uniref:Uncharacterized protein n=1 Tax=invertebrate metagenome TaxID=1711999 RepID=A0A2H9T3D5_9ZZZZ